MNSVYKNILVIAGGFIILSILFESEWFTYLALFVIVISSFSEKVADYINHFWLGLAKLLGWINSRIILSIIYFLILLPLSVFNRIVGNQNVLLRNNKSSLFKDRNHHYSKNEFEKPW